jgi:membrane-associated phospholipid phosphatase
VRDTVRLWNYRLWMRVGVLVLGSMTLAPGSHLFAQARPSGSEEPSRDSARVIHWTDAVWAAGGVALLSLIDEDVQRYTQKHRSNTLESFAAVFREQGSAIYYGGISLGVLSVGMISGDDGIKRAGGRLVATVAGSSIVMQGMKMLVGRSRPNANAGAYDFHPFSTLEDSAGIEQRESMPSGHTTVAFAVATSVADDIKSLPVSVLLYLWASGAAFSRVYENRHWLSDTAVGAVLGITSAKIITGRWRVFNIRPPQFLIAPSGDAALVWNLEF